MLYISKKIMTVTDKIRTIVENFPNARVASRNELDVGGNERGRVVAVIDIRTNVLTLQLGGTDVAGNDRSVLFAEMRLGTLGGSHW